MNSILFMRTSHHKSSPANSRATPLVIIIYIKHDGPVIIHMQSEVKIYQSSIIGMIK